MLWCTSTSALCMRWCTSCRSCEARPVGIGFGAVNFIQFHAHTHETQRAKLRTGAQPVSKRGAKRLGTSCPPPTHTHNTHTSAEPLHGVCSPGAQPRSFVCVVCVPLMGMVYVRARERRAHGAGPTPRAAQTRCPVQPNSAADAAFGPRPLTPRRAPLLRERLRSKGARRF
jgi:hypothetical protein